MRSIGPAILTALPAPNVRMIYFVRLHFDSGVLAWHSGAGTIAVDGYNYLAAGALSSVSVIKEEPGVKAAAVTVGLCGLKAEVVTAMLSEKYVNRKAYVHFVPLDDNDRPVSESPALLFCGTLDAIEGNIGTSAGFKVTLKSRLADWDRPRKILYTDAQQQKLHPGDKGMEYIGQLSQKKLVWPRAAFFPDLRD